MGAQQGNQYWRNATPNNPKKYANPGLLWDKFVEYMNDNAIKFWYKEDYIKSGPDAGRIIKLKVPNPPSISGFCIYAGISRSTFAQYCKNDSDWQYITSTIQDTIATIQIDGASTNTFNANIVARITGLVDKKEIDLKSDLSDDERSEMIKNILSKIKKNDDDLV